MATDIAGLDQLKQHYLKQLKERLVRLEKAMVDLQLSLSDPAKYDALLDEIHRLNGTGTTYGFPEISATAGALETCLMTGSRDIGKLLVLMADLVNAIRASLAEAREAPAAEESVTEPPKETHSGYRPTILVADDDPAILKLVTLLLADMANVECVAAGRAVIAAIAKRRYDLVILDCRLPDMTGLDVLTRIRHTRHGGTSPVMMLTAVSDPARVIEMISAGAHHYVVKPLVPAQFIERVLHVIEQQKKIVMVVDDDPLVREIFRRKFTQRGYEVVLATNGAEALNMILQIHPQAVVLDRGMPKLDGIQVIQQLRKSNETRSIPVVMLSARSSSDDIHDGYREGVDVYMAKPFLPDQVIDCCESLLQTRGSANTETTTAENWTFI